MWAACLGLLLGAMPATAQSRTMPVPREQRSQPPKVERVQVHPATPKAEVWRPRRASSTACIDVGRIGGAILVDARTLDVILRTGQRYRLSLSQACAQLSYYGGFYYQPSQNGKFCAGQDHVIARAGGSCRVTKIAELRLKK